MTDEDLIRRLDEIHNETKAAHSASRETNHRISAVETAQAVSDAKVAIRVLESINTQARIEHQHEALVGRLWALFAAAAIAVLAALFALFR